MPWIRERARTGASTICSAVLAAWLSSACGGGTEPTSTNSQPSANVAAGRAAFLVSCAMCHASRDGFDLALFGFDDATIVRRARDHVDLTTAQNIVAYVRSLGVPSVGRSTVPFQPGNTTLGADEEFWTALVGTTDVGKDLTAERIRSVDLRKAAVPIRLLTWSSEPDETDWLPETPLEAGLERSVHAQTCSGTVGPIARSGQ